MLERQGVSTDIVVAARRVGPTSEAQKNRVHCKDHCSQQLGSFVHSFEINFLSAAARDHTSKLQPDEQACEGEHKAEHP
jgi:hypothetical protein